MEIIRFFLNNISTLDRMVEKFIKLNNKLYRVKWVYKKIF